MHYTKLLYACMLCGSIVYFLLYGLVMKKLPVITIRYEERSSLFVLEEENTPSHELVVDNGAKEEKPAISSNVSVPSISTTNLSNLPPTKKFSKIFNEEENSKEDENNNLLNFLSNFKKGDDDVNRTVVPLETTQTTLKPSTLQGENIELGNDLAHLMAKINRLEKRNITDDLPECVRLKKVGLMFIRKKPPSYSMKDVEKMLPFVNEGGSWKPKTCRSKKVAVVVPYRDRESHLILFLLHMHRFLRWQLLEYRIYIIEQFSQGSFNRGMLMNVGFQEAMKVEQYDCVIFHDVDLLPEDDRNDYSCPSSPRHMSTAVDTMDYKLGYKKIFGGVEAFWPEHFQSINGFPNRYWGWGGEDDDLYVRVTDKKSLGLTRPAYQIGRYTMIKHTKSTDKNPERHRMLRESKQHFEKDGLNTLKYDIVNQQNFALYTLIAVDIKPDSASNSWW